MRRSPSSHARSGIRPARRVITATAVAALSIAMAACSSSGSTSSGSSSGSSSSGGSASSSSGAGAAASSKYPWCGSQKASIALADGFGDNTWRELTRYSAVAVAAQCPSVTQYTYANGEGNTQKAISDINSLVAQGVNAIVDFPDAGQAMLPALTKAYQARASVGPYRVFPGRKAGKNYNP